MNKFKSILDDLDTMPAETVSFDEAEDDQDEEWDNYVEARERARYAPLSGTLSFSNCSFRDDDWE